MASIDTPINGQTPVTIIHAERPKAQEKWQYLEERLRVIEGASKYRFETADLCLIPDIVIPHKFKVPDFDKNKRSSCPKNYLVSYCRKMVAYTQDDKLLVHFFQESLMGAAYSWDKYERGDLAEALLKQYQYNEELAPDRTQL
ncbi:hypothetical protein CR513_43140, partial [Mucuna pruriens]